MSTPFDSTTEWDVDVATGSNTNGGSFIPGASGVDHSMDATPAWSLTGLTSAGSGDTLLTASADNNMVGNGIYIVSGTNINIGWYNVISVVAGVSITLSTRSSTAVSVCTGVAASVVANIGGRLRWPAIACEAIRSASDGSDNDAGGNTIWVKAFDYNVTTFPGAGVNVDNGPIFLSTNSSDPANHKTKLYGYKTDHGDSPVKDHRPKIILQDSLTSSEITAIDTDGALHKGTDIQYFDIDCGTGNTLSNGVYSRTNYQDFSHISVRHSLQYGIVPYDQIQHWNDIEVYDFGGVGVQALFSAFPLTTFLNNIRVYSEISPSVGFYFYPALPANPIRCAAWDVSYGLITDHDGGCKNFTFANCTQAIYLISRGTTTTNVIENCIFWNCTTALFSEDGTSHPSATVKNCAFGSNGTDFDTGWSAATQTGNITLSGDPFTNLAGDDIWLKTSGAGLQCTGTGTNGSNIGWDSPVYVMTSGDDAAGDGSFVNPYASPGKAGNVASPGTITYFKAGTYTISSVTPNVPGGTPIFNGAMAFGGGATHWSKWIGYNATPGDNPAAGSRPVFKLQDSLTSAEIWCIRGIQMDGNRERGFELNYIDLDCGSGNTNAGCIHPWTNDTNFRFSFCQHATGLKGTILVWDGREEFTDIEIANCTTHGFFAGGHGMDTSTLIQRFKIHDITGTNNSAYWGYPGQPADLLDGLIYNITGGGLASAMVLDESTGAKNVTVQNCNRGIYLIARGGQTPNIENVLFDTITNEALFSESSTAVPGTIKNCGFRACGTMIGAGWTSATETGHVNIGADPFTNKSGGDFTLNPNNPGGAQLRGTGTSGANIGWDQTVYAGGGSAIGADATYLYRKVAQCV